jgi:HlyD family secretion protein
MARRSNMDHDTPERAGSEGLRSSLNDLTPLADRTKPGHRSRRLAILVVVVIVVALVAVRIAQLTTRAISVEVVSVARGDVEETVTNTRAGTVKARTRARLAPEINGRVIAIPHREGARVDKGDILLKLDDSMQRAQADLAAEDVRTAEARAEEVCLAADLAGVELKRYTVLHEGGIGSDDILDSITNERERSLAACRAARATLEQAKARARVAHVELDRTEFRAPFSGVVAEVSTEVGEIIASAFLVEPVLDLIDPSSIYVTAPIDEMDAERVAVDQPVEITVDSRRGERFGGRLVRVAPYVLDSVEQNRTVEVEAELDDGNVAASLLPGTSADVEIVLEKRTDVLRVPTGAIAQGGKVLVVVDDRLEERTIETGLSNWRYTEVTSGLDEGVRIVVSRDAPNVKPGVKVEIREAP